MITYPQLQQSLIQIDAEMGASEAHGLLNGLLCTANKATLVVWKQIILENSEPNNAQIQTTLPLLATLYNETLAHFQANLASISPLLPDDNAPLAHRLEMLAHWVDGFLYGLGLGQANMTHFSKEAKEALSSMTELTKIDLENMIENEESEVAFAELFEFLKVASTLIKEELINEEI